MPPAPRHSALSSPQALAAVAFLGHYPALWLLTRRRLPSRTARANLWALGLTLVAMLVAGWAFGAAGAAAAWGVGHFTWSVLLARAAYLEHSLLTRDSAACAPRPPAR